MPHCFPGSSKAVGDRAGARVGGLSSVFDVYLRCTADGHYSQIANSLEIFEYSDVGFWRSRPRIMHKLDIADLHQHFAVCQPLIFISISITQDSHIVTSNTLHGKASSPEQACFRGHINRLPACVQLPSD
jgi:hypothetical protein